MRSLIIIFVVSAVQVYGSKFKLDYCNVSTVAGCSNKTHLMCEAETSSTTHSLMSETTVERYILNPLNEYRNQLRRFKFVSNLKNFTWNDELARMAREALTDRIMKNPFVHCNITQDYKNVLLFNRTIDAKILVVIDSEIQKLFEVQMKPISEISMEFSWMASAYSTQIGCSKSIRRRFVCFINGVELASPDQSYVYEHDIEQHKLAYSDKKCLHQSSTNHFIGTNRNLPNNLITLSLTMTSTKFILYKFEQDQQNVTWDFDLQRIVEHFVSNNLTETDKCVAHRYPKMRSILLSGIEFFREQISNIDSVWEWHTVDTRIGCAAFVTDNNTIDYFHLYCITGNRYLELHQNYIISFLDWAGLERSHYWLIYLLLILLYLNIFAALVLIRNIKVYEMNRLLDE